MTPKDEDNAIAALEHRDRISSVELFVAGSELEKMTAVMQEPFPVLTNLCMHSKDENVLTATFLGGSAPHLQEITLQRIVFPVLPTLLLSTSDLVTLHLLDMPMPGYIPSKRMAACLAALPRLEAFSISYQDIVSCPRIHPPPVARPILPALTFFSFQGSFEYLEDLVARIDTPRLDRVSIIYLEKPDDFQVTQVSDFIDRSIGPGLSKIANVHFQYDRVTFTLSRDYKTYQGRNRRSISTTISHEVFDWPRLSDVAWVMGQFSAVLCTVVYLELEVEFDHSADLDRAYDVDWLHLLRQFSSTQTLCVYQELAAPVSLSLQDITEETVTEVLPSLGLICLEGEPASSLEKIVAIRRFSDHPITVVETREEFNKKIESY